MRRKNPTTVAETNKVSQSTIQQRSQETMAAAIEIYGGPQQNQSPGTFGMLETLETRSSVKDITEAISSGGKLKNKVFPKVYKQDLSILQTSTENMLIYCYLL